MNSYDPIPHSGVFDQIFYLTRATIQIFGFPANGYTIDLIQLLVVIVLAFLVIFVSERLTQKKTGGLVAGVLITFIGAFVIQALTNSIPDFVFEGVRIVSTLVGAIIIGVFYTLIRARFAKK
jgi:uncharacterized membrane protein YeaQ/YmgE (transglycosylase-associated protein family)